MNRTSQTNLPEVPDAGAGAVPCISVVVPLLNEQAVLPEFHARLTAVAETLPYAFEILYVDDGSSDRTVEIIRAFRAGDPRVGLLILSRNFGKEAAMTAGLDVARGDAVILIDADLQDPPELIPDLVQPWAESGADVVYAQRLSRAGEPWHKRLSAAAFYRLMQHVDRARLPPNVGDFRLLSRRAVEGIKQLRERHRFMKGLFAWVGYRQKAVPYNREPRFAGSSKWNYVALWNFSIEGITGFTTAPLKVATYLGLLVALFAVVFGFKIIYDTLVHGNDVPGYPSLMVVILFLGGVQLVTMGILGEYVGRIFDESKQRPLYLVQDHLEAEAGVASGQAVKTSSGTD